jgi:hypothetical protein
MLGHSPHVPHQLTGHGHHDLVGIFAACQQSSRALTQPHLGFPTDGLDGFMLVFQAQLEVSTDFGCIPIRPGTFNQGATGMGIPGFGNGTLVASLPHSSRPVHRPGRKVRWMPRLLSFTAAPIRPIAAIPLHLACASLPTR